MFKRKLLPFLLLALLCLLAACGAEDKPSPENEPAPENAPESRLLSDVFRGADTSALNGAVQRPGTSVENGEFKLTLEEYLVSDFQVLLSFTVEALTDQAKAELFHLYEDNRNDFWDTHKATLTYQDGSDIMSRGQGGQWGFRPEEDTAKTSQYAIIDWYNLKTDGNPLLLTVGDLSLEVPMTPNIPTTSIDVEQDDVMLKLDWNAIGLVLECIKDPEASDTDSKSQNEAIRFRTAEGGLKTYNELFQDMGNHSNTLSLGNIWLIRHARFKQPPQEGEFTSIIIGGKEFSLTDGEYLGDYTE